MNYLYKTYYIQLLKTKKIIWVFIIFPIFSCQFWGDSENIMIKEYYNPKSNMKVVIFEKLGNATVNNSIQASIHGPNFELNNAEVGNIFVADKIEGIKKSKDSLLIVNWIDNATVEFTYPKKVRIFKTEKQFENNNRKVRIKYKSTD
ncbi:hypothetical protein [Dokdonia sp.]|uniref:hypothetical protein n=1 Tax=Dokdonia sp. TaxID=2024995 RepID=UPI003264F73D